MARLLLLLGLLALLFVENHGKTVAENVLVLNGELLKV